MTGSGVQMAGTRVQMTGTGQNQAECCSGETAATCPVVVVPQADPRERRG